MLPEHARCARARRTSSASRRRRRSLTGMSIVFVVVTAALRGRHRRARDQRDLGHPPQAAARAAHRRLRRSASPPDRCWSAPHLAIDVAASRSRSPRCRCSRSRCARSSQPLPFAVRGRSASRCSTRSCPARQVAWRTRSSAACSPPARSRRRKRRLRVVRRRTSPTYEVVYGALAALPHVPALDLRVLDDRARGRCGDGVARRAPAEATRRVTPRTVEARCLPNRRSQATLRRVLRKGASPRVVHHPGSGLADLAADRRVDHRARADLRAPVVAAPEPSSRRPGWSITCSPNTGRPARRRSCSRRPPRRARSAASSPPASPT